MPLPIPQLDDRRFKDLVTTLRDQIPSVTKEWTDFNPSDPGMALLELWCWLAEMVLYRINQVPQRNYDNFFKLILDPPEPVTAEVTLEIFPQLSAPFDIPPGIRFATPLLVCMGSPPDIHPLSDGGRWIFETYTRTPVPVIAPESPPSFSPPEVVEVTFPVRSKVVVENEELGVSNGQPDQIFYFKHQVLIDENNIGAGSGDYNPNPRLKVITGAGEELWQYVPDFLETTGPDSPHFMVEPRTNRVRFGGGKAIKGRGGKIPSAGARIVAAQYQIILGKEVRLDKDMLEEILDPIPGLLPEEIIAINNAAAAGGDYLYSFREEASTTGLQFYKEEFRAITPEDFAGLVLTQFNRSQESACVPERPENRVARAVAVAGKNFAKTPPDEPAAISVIILPKTGKPEDLPVVTGPAFDNLKEKVFRFLDRRRLITTRLYVEGPQPVGISLRIEATTEPRTKAADIASEMKKRIGQFFHPLTGGHEGNGWPLGRDVYKSELFQLIEAIAGVDHVNRIVMNDDSSLNSVALAENQLPLIDVEDDVEIIL